MDPDQALRDLRAALAKLHKEENIYVWSQHALDAADAAQKLDDWISDGGFLPRDWTRS